MIDLEQEFEKLMRVVRKQIEDKQSSGELTTEEAIQLTNMVNVRMFNPNDDTVDDGWNNSSRACADDAWDPSQKCW